MQESIVDVPRSASDLNKIGIIYTDTALPDKIQEGTISIEYEGERRIQLDAVVHILIVYLPSSFNFLYLNKIPCFCEAISCILSFSYRRRFISSTMWWNLNKKKKMKFDSRAGEFREYEELFDPIDLFSRITFNPSIHQLSPEILTERTKIFYMILKKIYDLDQDNFYRLMRSFRLYQLALLTYQFDVGLSYSLLVASVDNISSKIYNDDDLKLKKDDVLDSEWKKIIKKYSNNPDLEKEILLKLKKRPWSKRKFIKFFKDFLSDSFWTSYDSKAWERDRWDDFTTPWNNFSYDRARIDSHKQNYEHIGKEYMEIFWELNEEEKKKLEESFKGIYKLSKKEEQELGHKLRHWNLYREEKKLTREELPDILGQIYSRVRSGFLHRGVSPPESAIDDYETAPLELKYKGNGSIVWERNIPSFYFFERLVHETILNYIIQLIP